MKRRVLRKRIPVLYMSVIQWLCPSVCDSRPPIPPQQLGTIDDMGIRSNTLHLLLSFTTTTQKKCSSGTRPFCYKHLRPRPKHYQVWRGDPDVHASSSFLHLALFFPVNRGPGGSMLDMHAPDGAHRPGRCFLRWFQAPLTVGLVGRERGQPRGSFIATHSVDGGDWGVVVQ